MTSITTSTTAPDAPRAGRRRIGVLLPDAGMGGGFAKGGATGIARLGESSAPDLDLRHDVPNQPDPAWTDLLCHGVEWVPWLREHAAHLPTRVVLTDWVPLRGVTMVDWCWDQAAYLAGVAAAHLAAKSNPIGLVAGPPVPTQRRIAAALAAGAHDGGHRGPVAIVHATSFDDRVEGERLGQVLRESVGCTVLAHTADATGEEACHVAREHGAVTLGFLEPLGDHAAVIDSDVAGVVERLLTLLGTSADLSPIYDAGLTSGHLDLTVADSSLHDVIASYRPRAIAIGCVTPDTSQYEGAPA